MKPYKLNWWLEQYIDCYDMSIDAITFRDKTQLERYTTLLKWIENRIIKKYGEPK